MAIMIGGRLNTPQILATTNPTVVYTVPADYAAIVNLSLTNRTTNTIKVRVAISEQTTPGNEEWIEWETTMTPRAVFERTQITMQPGRNLIVRVDTIDSVAVTVYGFLNPINVSLEGVEEVLEEQVATPLAVTNGTFNTNLTGWTVTGTASVIAGQAVLDADTSPSTVLEQIISPVTQGTSYRVNYDIIGWTGPSTLLVQTGDPSFPDGNNITDFRTGPQQAQSTSSTSDFLIRFTAGGGTVTIDNVTITELPGGGI